MCISYLWMGRTFHWLGTLISITYLYGSCSFILNCLCLKHSSIIKAGLLQKQENSREYSRLGLEMYMYHFINVELWFIVASFTRIIAWMYSVKEGRKRMKTISNSITLFKMSATVLCNSLIHTLSHSIFVTPLKVFMSIYFKNKEIEAYRLSCLLQDQSDRKR